MLLNQEIEVILNSGNISHYKKLGYHIPKVEDKWGNISTPRGTKIIIKVNDLPNNSHVKVEVKCDCEECLDPYLKPMSWQSYFEYVRDNDKYYCVKCAKKIFAANTYILTKIRQGKSFEQWCKDNNQQNILDLWDYDLNIVNPSEITYGTNNEYYFKCSLNLHKSELKNIKRFTDEDTKIKCHQCNSFKQWCIENNRQDVLDRWDYELNKCSPLNVSYGQNEKYWFKCEKGIHKSELKNLNSFTSGQIGSILCKACNSFEQWCLDNDKLDILDRWDNNLNKIKPIEVDYGVNKKFYFKCPVDKHKSELKSLSSIAISQYKTICKSCNSFAQWGIDNLGEDFLETYWDYEKNININPWELSKQNSKTKIWIKCQEKDYHGSYDTTCAGFAVGNRCGYCRNRNGKVHLLDSLGTLFPESLKVWSNKNINSPYKYSPKSEKDVYWKCPEGLHDDYERNVKASNNYNFRCPECVRERDESFLQEKVRLFIESTCFTILHENKCTILPINPKTKYPLPFDNEIKELKLIIEVHGKQHYNLKDVFCKKHITKEEALHYIKLKDRYKRIFAKKQGYFYLEIPYWTDDKYETWKVLLNDKINEIKGD